MLADAAQDNYDIITPAMSDKASPVPKTSETLLLQLSRDANHARWAEFVARYRPMMERYLTRHFPTIDGEDIIQETFIALVKVLPNYRYSPDETGRFHNYLTGILRRKALRLTAKDAQRAERLASLENDATRTPPRLDAQAEEEWKHAVFETAIHQLLNDESIAPHSCEVFRALALAHENPADVAARFGLTRNAVDQIKNRLMTKLRKLADELKGVV